MNRALKRISLACLAMFVLLLINVNYVQAFESGSLAGRPGNIRVFDEQFQYQRGAIVADGNPLHPITIAESRLIKGTNIYRRYYPFGPQYAAVTGYDSIYGKTAIEYYENKELTGTDPRLAVNNLVALFTGKSNIGATVNLTISPAAQLAAYDALQAQAASDGNKPAAVVALDPSTGAILAMMSWPSFNPNRLTTFSGSRLDRVDKRLLNAPGSPLLNKAIEETWPPGSSFKIVTGSTWLSGRPGRSSASTVQAPPVLKLPNGNLLHNDSNEICGNGRPPLIEAFYLSCNTAFGKLGIDVGARPLFRQANLFGWNQGLATPLPVVPSRYPLETDPSLRALSAIGQFNDEVTPMQEAMDAAAIAHGGTLMTPYLVQSVQAISPALSNIQSATPKVLSHVVTSRVAGQMGQMMLAVTQNPSGTAYATAGPPAVGSLQIAGKTGTAENGFNNTGLNDAVFTCYAPYSNPQIAVGVIVQGGGYGADAAAPIAVKIIQAYLGHP